MYCVVVLLHTCMFQLFAYLLFSISERDAIIDKEYSQVTGVFSYQFPSKFSKVKVSSSYVMAFSGARASPNAKEVPVEPPGPDLSTEAKKKGGGYPISKNCLLCNKSGKVLTLSDRDALTCPSCILILRNPYQVISCGHRYCQDCLEKILQSRWSINITIVKPVTLITCVSE